MNNRIILLLLFFPAAAAFPFGLDLNTAERLALESSDEINNAREQIKLAALQNKLGIRNFLPSLELSFASGRQVDLHSGDSDSLQLGFSVSQPVFDGGRSLENIRLAGIQLDIQAAALESSIEQLRDNVWEFFYGLLLNREKLKLQRELLDITVEQLGVTAKKYEMGTLTELDYLEAAIEVREMELDIMDTETGAENLAQDFAVLLGFDHLFFEKNPLELEGALDREYQGLQLWEDDRKVWERMAVTENLDLKAKRVELEQIKTRYEITKRAFIPAVSLEANLSFSGVRFPLQEPGGSLSLSFEFPCEPAPTEISAGSGFQGNDQISRSGSSKMSVLPDLGFITDKKTAGLQLHQAAADIDNSEITLARSIRSTLRELEQMRLRLTIRRNTQDLQKKRLDILEKRNLMGEVTEADLLEARIEYYGEETGIIEGVMELIRTERSFEKMTGAGLGELEALSAGINGYNK